MLFRTYDSTRRGSTAAALALSLAAACGPAGDAGTSPSVAVTDPAGRAVTLDRPARLVVSMMPAVTEWIVAMGGADRLVARTDYDTQPALDSLPSVGGGLTPSIEWLAARSPDLVIAWPDAPSRSIVSRLEQVGIAVYTAPIETIEQAIGVAADLGTLLGVETAADSAIAAVGAGLDSVRHAVAGRPRPDVLFLIGLDPLMAAGPGTFVDELITAAGARNVLQDLDIRWPQLSLEEVVRRAPSVLIVGTASTDDPAALLADRPGWRQLPAVREGAVHPVDPDFVNRPGPHLHEAAALLARLVHTGEPERAGAAALTLSTAEYAEGAEGRDSHAAGFPPSPGTNLLLFPRTPRIPRSNASTGEPVVARTPAEARQTRGHPSISILDLDPR